MPPLVNGASVSDLLLFALYRLGGSGQFVDVEDIFVEAWNIDPARLRWRKYNFPNYKLAHTALSDISRRGQGDLYFSSEDGLSRQLTAKGRDWVEARLHAFTTVVSGEAPVPLRRPGQRGLAEVERSEAFRRFKRSMNLTDNRNDIAELFRFAPDSPRTVWRERLETLKAVAADAKHHELINFLQALETEHADWFGTD